MQLSSTINRVTGILGRAIDYTTIAQADSQFSQMQAQLAQSEAKPAMNRCRGVGSLGCKAFTGLTRQPVQLRLRAVISRIEL